MKVFALGGTGEYGWPTVQSLIARDRVTELVIGARNLERAQAAAATLGAKASAVQVDATDERRLAQVAAGADVLVNLAGPAAHVQVPALRVAIALRTHYADVHAPGSTRSLDAGARAAGITAIVGNGLSPGLTNVLRVAAARVLDEVDEIHLGIVMAWSLGFRLVRALESLADPAETLAAITEVVEPYTEPHLQPPPVDALEYWLGRPWETGGGAARRFRDGRWLDVDPALDGVEAPLPDGTVALVRPEWSAAGRSQPRTLAMEFTGFPPQLDGLLRERLPRIQRGDLSAAAAAAEVRAIVRSSPPRWLSPVPGFAPLPFFWCVSLGRHGGRPARHTFWPAPGLVSEANWELLTGAPLIVAVDRLLAGEVSERGVVTPQQVFDPLPLFDAVGPLLPEPPVGGRMLRSRLDLLA